MKAAKLTHRISTSLFTLLLGMGATMYFVSHEMVVEAFEKLHYPTYLIYPLAIAKVLGLIALWSPKFPTLKQFAYAGFMYDLILGIVAHVAISDGEFLPATIGLTLLATSFISDRYLARRAEAVPAPPVDGGS